MFVNHMPLEPLIHERQYGVPGCSPGASKCDGRMCVLDCSNDRWTGPGNVCFVNAISKMPGGKMTAAEVMAA